MLWDIPRPPVQDPDETISQQTRDTASPDMVVAPPSLTNDQAIAADDPLGDYLDKMDEAFERLEPEGSGGRPRGRTAPEPPHPAARHTSTSDTEMDSLEGALSALEGALDNWALDGLDTETADAPDGSASGAGAAPPPLERSATAPVASAETPPADKASPIVEPAPEPRAAPVPQLVSAPEPVSEVVVEPTSVTETPRRVEIPASATPGPVETASPAPVASASPAPAALPPPALSAQLPAEAIVRTAPPSLADAFASLLAAEQGDTDRARTVYPWPGPGPSAGVTEALIEQVTERVIARLSDSVTNELVARVVTRVAERLVREEIDRINQV